MNSSVVASSSSKSSSVLAATSPRMISPKRDSKDKLPPCSLFCWNLDNYKDYRTARGSVPSLGGTWMKNLLYIPGI